MNDNEDKSGKVVSTAVNVENLERALGHDNKKTMPKRIHAWQEIEYDAHFKQWEDRPDTDTTEYVRKDKHDDEVNTLKGDIQILELKLAAKMSTDGNSDTKKDKIIEIYRNCLSAIDDRIEYRDFDKKDIYELIDRSTKQLGDLA